MARLVLICVLCGQLALGDLLGELNRTKMYEALYRSGYHSQLGLSHAGPLIKHFVNPAYAHVPDRARTRVLDVGCSHGRGVEMLWRHGYCGGGSDLAQTAVDMAIKARVPSAAIVARCGPASGAEIFRQGSAAALPWPSRHFAAIISTDVLEHVPEPLIPSVVREFARVARDKLFLMIATQPEGASIRRGHEVHREELRAQVFSGGDGIRVIC
ncbi:hypothetical protein T492DRAFT_515409 [Pavlovales sp. CCMP2436]|nr:hypothetical protein T492DRAFT_515409 [Pavlovales sp. CCMP2436]